ncbi:ATP-binding protein [Streptomyces sp. NPDC047097]|uniref:ATP-binding protein n=1 Tax=Streptomyces sp. NPDC047097 TaxID=3155260 RepID=UPI0033F1C8A4
MGDGRQGGRRPRLPARAPSIEPGYSETLPRERETAGIARELVRAALDRWCLPQPADDAAVVVTEFVANAVDHAKGRTVRVTVTLTGATCIRISVVDGVANRQPRTRAADPDAERGRGMLLVEAVSERWGVDTLPWGKRVWAELEAKTT